jgi:hypothetical protein
MKKLFATIAAVLAVGTAGTVWLAGASSALAPEPVRLNGSLGGNGTYASAAGLNSGGMAWAYQWTNSWAASSTVPAGAPCASYNAPSGTTLTSVIQRVGSFVRCY